MYSLIGSIHESVYDIANKELERAVPDARKAYPKRPPCDEREEKSRPDRSRARQGWVFEFVESLWRVCRQVIIAYIALILDLAESHDTLGVETPGLTLIILQTRQLRRLVRGSAASALATICRCRQGSCG